MTRPDFLEGGDWPDISLTSPDVAPAALDHVNIVSIDVHHNVRPDSMLILRAATEVVQAEGFDDLLQGVRARVDEIESLHRTRELTFKDLQEVSEKTK